MSRLPHTFLELYPLSILEEARLGGFIASPSKYYLAPQTARNLAAGQIFGGRPDFWPLFWPGQIFGRGQITTCRRLLHPRASTGEDLYSTRCSVMAAEKGDLGVGVLHQEVAGVLLLSVVEWLPLRS